MSFYVALMSFIDSLTDREDGQGLAEYALILALIAIVVIGVRMFELPIGTGGGIVAGLIGRNRRAARAQEVRALSQFVFGRFPLK